MLNMVLGVVVMFYDGCVCFGLLGDYDVMVDFDAFVEDFVVVIDEFVFITIVV